MDTFVVCLARGLIKYLFLIRIKLKTYALKLLDIFDKEIRYKGIEGVSNYE